ncbi:hypothetical protein QRX60_37135 [Amycolatopsis mongoliensis]|uniref:IrrE N-terminal-like domain-containing protein n=1 Tax=Amycolatopsis mongoliensis TaxID=715475 RepID=A0A9Y2NJ01_9PSEU|nr:hypothetical protein [Amycolatopsis sp. 4-36]WIX99639.1 hypothetical protein QRX60_37135 [Amycolatopsis sp. 4-36]
MTSSVIAPRCTRLAPGERGGPIDERGLTELRAGARERVRTVLGAVPMPRPWSMNVWVDRLEAWRGREIDLVPVEYRPGRPSGAWQPRPDYDLIAYVEHTSALHQDHIIAHELAHMLCAHTGTCQMSESEAARLAPDLAPQALSHLLTRVTTGTDEYEAELIAVLLLSAATSEPPAVQPDASGRAAEQARRLAALLG